MIEILIVHNKCTTTRHNEVRPTYWPTPLCLGVVHLLCTVSAIITSHINNTVYSPNVPLPIIPMEEFPLIFFFSSIRINSAKDLPFL